MKAIIINLQTDQIVPFNMKNISIIGTYKECMYCMKLTHPEFETVQLGHEIPEFDQEEARKRYPYLFIDTNPLLWRKF